MQFLITYFIYQIKNHIILQIIETVMFTKNYFHKYLLNRSNRYKVKRSLLNGNRI